MKVYHIVPKEFIGYVLYPLNGLKGILPKIYDRERNKYRGRTQMTERVIPHLDCLWNDTLHFSPVHPAVIRDVIVEVGFQWHVRDWFEVDPAVVGFDKSNAVIFTQPARPKGDYSVEEEDFVPFTLEVLEMLNSIPRETVEYFNHAKAHNERPFLFNFTPHVLYHGSIDTRHKGVDVITV